MQGKEGPSMLHRLPGGRHGSFLFFLCFIFLEKGSTFYLIGLLCRLNDLIHEKYLELVSGQLA